MSFQTNLLWMHFSINKNCRLILKWKIFQNLYKRRKNRKEISKAHHTHWSIIKFTRHSISKCTRLNMILLVIIWQLTFNLRWKITVKKCGCPNLQKSKTQITLSTQNAIFLCRAISTAPKNQILKKLVWFLFKGQALYEQVNGRDLSALTIVLT